MKIERDAQNVIAFTQSAAIDLLLTGASKDKVSKTLGVAARTIFRWQCEEPFKREMSRRKAELIRTGTTALSALHVRALEVLREHLEAGDLKAALWVLERSGLGDKPARPTETIEMGNAAEMDRRRALVRSVSLDPEALAAARVFAERIEASAPGNGHSNGNGGGTGSGH